MMKLAATLKLLLEFFIFQVSFSFILKRFSSKNGRVVSLKCSATKDLRPLGGQSLLLYTNVKTSC